MGQALYRKYRSRSLDDVVGQEHIVKTLKNALKTKQISHAYLFSGPRGVGKTSVARILAHEVNKLPYKGDSFNLDIIEIDAASNRRIDEIRDLRDKVHIAPTSSEYKVYIIDEVHMLTKEAFNALLKTLEEPPAHCIFILATTEAHKVPATIISRTQQFGFKPIEKGQAASHLKKIANKEKIEITAEALSLLAEHGQGSFRDSIGLLDQLRSSDQKIDAKLVSEALGLPPSELISEIVHNVETGQTASLIQQCSVIRQQALDAQAIAAAISQLIRNKLIEEPSYHVNTDLLKDLLEVASSSDPYTSLEISLIDGAVKNSLTTSVSQVTTRSLTVAEPPILEKTPSSSNSSDMSLASKPDTEFTLDDWPKVIELVKHEAASLYTALRLAQPKLSGSILTLVFEFPLHQKKVAQDRAKRLIGRIIEELSGSRLSIECVVNKSLINKNDSPELPANTSTKSITTATNTISNIFGGAELVES